MIKILKTICHEKPLLFSRVTEEYFVKLNRVLLPHKVRKSSKASRLCETACGGHNVFISEYLANPC